MNYKKSSFSIGMFLIQLGVAILILFMLSAYVWAVQLSYDSSIIGYERAFFYSLIIFGAGLSYDCAKKILFLEQSVFLRFAKKFFESMLDIGILVVLCALTTFFLSINYTVVGQLLYIAVFGWLWFVVNSISCALEEVASEVKH